MMTEAAPRALSRQDADVDVRAPFQIPRAEGSLPREMTLVLSGREAQ